MELTQQALVHYRSGELEQSLSLLQEAAQLVCQPVIIYNLARVYEASGDLEEALARYQEYLELDADAPDRGAVVVRIESLEEQLAERARLVAEQEAAREDASRLASRATEAELRAEQARASIWPWLLAGIGGSLLGAATVLGALALSEANSVAPDASHLTAYQAQDRADNLALAANICFVSSGILAGAGLTWGLVRFAISRRDNDRQVAFSFQGWF